MTRRTATCRTTTTARRQVTASIALLLAAAGLPVLGGSAAAQPALTEVTNEKLRWSYDGGAGCDVPGVWMLCVYQQQGLRSIARVLPDDHDAANRNGSLRLSTPEPEDRVFLEHHPAPGESTSTRFASLDRGTVRLDIVSGKGPAIVIGVSGCDSGAPDHLLLRYAGPVPEAGSGWQTVDLVAGGSAQWTEPRLGTHSWSFFQSLCPEGEAGISALEQTGPNHETRLDVLTLGDWGIDFVVPALTREAAPLLGSPDGDGAKGQRMARALATRQFQEGNWLDDWTDPSRLRVPTARAAVIGFQDAPALMLAAAALADRVQGVLLTNPSGKLRGDTWGALLNQVPRSRPVYLVGSSEQLTHRLVSDLSEQGWTDVRRLSGASNAATAVAVAQLIDRRRSERRRAHVVVVDSSQTAHSLAAPVLASQKQAALVLSTEGRLPRATRRYLTEQRSAVVSAVGPAASSAVPSIPRERRYAGRTPEATAVELARTFAAPRAVTVASVSRSLEAVLAARHAARWDQPLLLVRRDGISSVVLDHIGTLHDLDRESLLVGGTGSVDQPTFDRLRALLAAAR